MGHAVRDPVIRLYFVAQTAVAIFMCVDGEYRTAGIVAAAMACVVAYTWKPKKKGSNTNEH